MIASRRVFIASLAASSLAAAGEFSVTTDPERERRRDANAALMQRYAQAWRSGDLRTLLDCYHDDFTLHYFGENSLAGTHAGKPAALKVLAEVGRRTKRRLLAVVDIMASADRAALIAREAFERGGETVELERLFVYTTAEGRLRECWIYDADQRAVDRFMA